MSVMSDQMQFMYPLYLRYILQPKLQAQCTQEKSIDKKWLARKIYWRLDTAYKILLYLYSFEGSLEEPLEEIISRCFLQTVKVGF